MIRSRMIVVTVLVHCTSFGNLFCSRDRPLEFARFASEIRSRLSWPTLRFLIGFESPELPSIGVKPMGVGTITPKVVKAVVVVPAVWVVLMSDVIDAVFTMVFVVENVFVIGISVVYAVDVTVAVAITI